MRLKTHMLGSRAVLHSIRNPVEEFVIFICISYAVREFVRFTVEFANFKGYFTLLPVEKYVPKLFCT